MKAQGVRVRRKVKNHCSRPERGFLNWRVGREMFARGSEYDSDIIVEKY